MKTLKNIILVLSVILYYATFKTVMTRSLRRETMIRIKERWEGKRTSLMQEMLDAEHSTGRGTMFIDGKVKTYEPYTAASLRQ